MFTLLTTTASVLALVVGYLEVRYLWVLAIAIGYFLPLVLTRYDQIMRLLGRQRVGLVTVNFVWMYVAAVVGVSVNYGVGWLARRLVQNVF